MARLAMNMATSHVKDGAGLRLYSTSSPPPPPPGGDGVIKMGFIEKSIRWRAQGTADDYRVFPGSEFRLQEADSLESPPYVYL